MSRNQRDLDQELNQEDPNAELNADNLPLEEEGEQSEMARVMPAWLISFAVHAAIFLVFSMVVFNQAAKDEELPPMRLTVIDAPPEKKEEKKDQERTLEDKKEILIEQESDVVAPVTPVTVDTKIDTTVETDEPPRGREEAVSTSEMGGQGAFMAIGAGGGAGGMYGSRTGNGKRQALARGGGSKGSESAVDAALRWFKKHQSPNGMWDTVNYYQNCTEEGKCEKGGSHEKSDANVAVTGYALLCFLGAGYDHKTPNKYRPTIEAGIRWLKEQQKGNGLFGNRNYEHAVATMALSEAYAMTQDGELRSVAQNAVDYLISVQNKNGKDKEYGGGSGWDYINPTGREDSSVTGWCVMALKSANGAGLDVKNGMNGAKDWLKQTYELSNPDHAQLDPYTGIAEFTYAWKDGKIQGDAGQKGNRVPMGALSAVFLGHHAGDKMLETMLNFIMKYQVPKSFDTDLYYMYYNTLTVFQAGGERWQTFNNSVRDMVIKAQRRDACYDGSWDWENGGFHGKEIGRTLTTAFCCLSLEVYYRYKQIGAAGAK